MAGRIDPSNACCGCTNFRRGALDHEIGYRFPDQCLVAENAYHRGNLSEEMAGLV